VDRRSSVKALVIYRGDAHETAVTRQLLSGVKVNCTLVQALRLCTGRTAYRGSRRIALPFLDHGTRRGWGVSITPRQLFTPGKDPVPIVQEAGWASGPVCTGAENLAPTGIRSLDRPARSQSLYRLRCPALGCFIVMGKKWWEVTSVVTDYWVGDRGRPDHDQHHAPKVKPEAATTVVELLMMGVRTPETCWAVHKRQAINLRNCCI